MPDVVSQVDNVWRHWWAGQMRAVGAISRLPVEPIHPDLMALFRPPPSLGGSIVGRKARRTQERSARRIRSKTDTPGAPPRSDWAKFIHGDGRISNITLSDLLESIDDCFSIFKDMRRMDRSIYDYFSRVGVPIITQNTAIWRSQLDSERVRNVDRLPSMVGAFFAENEGKFRKEVIETGDHKGFGDFIFFTKLSMGNIITNNRHDLFTLAPPGSAVYYYSELFLDRSKWFDKQEQNKYRWTSGPWGVGFLIGVLPDGTVRALPMQRQKRQRLPSGHVVHHSSFGIPDGIGRLAGPNKNPHNVAKLLFHAITSFISSSISGVSVLLKKDGLAVRIGVPVNSLKSFFAGRDGTGKILHFVGSHQRNMADGRIIDVGEHLRGSRTFEWNGCEVILTVPGIHSPSPEGFSAETEMLDEGQAIPNGWTDLSEVGDIMARNLWSPHKVPIRRGQPTETYIESGLPRPHAP